MTTPADDVADRLHSAAIHLLRLVRQEDKASGLSPARLSALSVLVFGGPRTVGALAAAEQVRSPTMSRLLAGMEADGLVARRPSSDDGRSVLVAATDSGRRAVQEGRRRRVATLAALVRDLSPGDIEVLDRAARLMEEISRTRPGP